MKSAQERIWRKNACCSQRLKMLLCAQSAFHRTAKGGRWFLGFSVGESLLKWTAIEKSWMASVGYVWFHNTICLVSYIPRQILNSLNWACAHFSFSSLSSFGLIYDGFWLVRCPPFNFLPTVDNSSGNCRDRSNDQNCLELDGGESFKDSLVASTSF